jgi:hypothetical protein
MAVTEQDFYGQALNAAGYFPARKVSHFALGCDLGQAVDPTAICVVEKIVEGRVPLEVGTDLRQVTGPARFEARYLERLPLQTSYVAAISHVGRLLSRPPLANNCELVIDMTGVGRAVCDMFTTAGLHFTGVTITGGDHERQDSEDGTNWHVSKIQLVSRLQALFHSGDLKIAKSLPEATALATELQDFRASISEAGYASFGARVGKHDDLVLALALACWQLIAPWRNRVTITQFRL